MPCSPDHNRYVITLVDKNVWSMNKVTCGFLTCTLTDDYVKLRTSRTDQYTGLNNRSVLLRLCLRKDMQNIAENLWSFGKVATVSSFIIFLFICLYLSSYF